MEDGHGGQKGSESQMGNCGEKELYKKIRTHVIMRTALQEREKDAHHLVPRANTAPNLNEEKLQVWDEQTSRK